MRVAIACRKARSWVTNSSVPGYAFRNPQSQVIESISRWLVGSSSNGHPADRQWPAPAAPAFHTGGKAVEFRLAIELHLGEHACDGLVPAPVFFLGNIQHAGDQIMDGLGVARGHFLYEAFDQQILRAIHRALIGRNIAGQQLEQGGFSAAIAADQADVFACVEIEVT